MTEEDMVFLQMVKQRIKDKPELFSTTIIMMVAGLEEKVSEAKELASDMEILAAGAIGMLQEKRVTSKTKEHFEKLLLSKLEKHNFKTFTNWDWAIEKKKG